MALPWVWPTNILRTNSASAFTRCAITSAEFMKNYTSRRALRQWQNSCGNETWTAIPRSAPVPLDTAAVRVGGHFIPNDSPPFFAILSRVTTVTPRLKLSCHIILMLAALGSAWGNEFATLSSGQTQLMTRWAEE